MNKKLLKYQLLFIPFIIIVTIFQSSCSNNNDSALSEIFPSPPDTSNILKLSNFLSGEERNIIIDEETKLSNGKKRLKGIIVVPQNGDDFRRVNLDTLYWHSEKIIEGDFRGASFRSSNCSDGVFSNSDFRVADMRWTNFSNSNLNNSKMTQAKLFHVHVNNADLSNCDFRGANMFGMEGHHSTLRSSNVSGALMKDVEFLDSDFTHVIGVKTILIRAVLIGSTLDSTDFSYSDFTGAGLENATFVHSRLNYVNFQGSHLQGTNFSGADLLGCNFFGAEFDKTNFTGATNIPKEIENLMVDGKVTGVSKVSSK